MRHATRLPRGQAPSPVELRQNEKDRTERVKNLALLVIQGLALFTGGILLTLIMWWGLTG